jgi:hypothetical protein
MGEKRLVRRNHILARCQSRLGRGFRGTVMAAHHLDENIDIVALRQIDGVISQAKPERSASRFLVLSRAETAVITTGRPARAAIMALWR